MSVYIYMLNLYTQFDAQCELVKQ